MRNSSSGCIPCPILPLDTKFRRTDAQPTPAVFLRESLEDWTYLAIAASAMVGLLLGILHQLESPASGAAGTERTRIIEHALPSQGKDGKF